MSQTQTKSSITIITPPTQPEVAQQVVSGQTLASILKDKGGRLSFLSFEAKYPMDNKGKMVVKHRVDKTPNPFLGKGVVKVAKTQATVNWKSTEEKVENREGEFSGKGNYQQVVLVGGKVTPLATHKEDIETTLPDGEEDKIANRVAVVKDGVLNFTTDHPRFYLRCEFVRAGGEGDRADRKMRSESHYQYPDGTLIEEEDIEPYLGAPKTRTDNTDIQMPSLNHITALKIDGETFKVI